MQDYAFRNAKLGAITTLVFGQSMSIGEYAFSNVTNTGGSSVYAITTIKINGNDVTVTIEDTSFSTTAQIDVILESYTYDPADGIPSWVQFYLDSSRSQWPSYSNISIYDNNNYKLN